MRTPGHRSRIRRAAIAIVALYALVLSGFLSGLAGTALAGPAADPAFAICHAMPADDGMPASDEAPFDCRTHCRLSMGAGTPLLARPAGAGLPVRFAVTADAPARTAPEAPLLRRIAAPLGSRAPPVSHSAS